MSEDTAREIAPLVMFGFGAERFIGSSPYQNGRMTDFRPAVLPADAPEPVQVEVAPAADEDPKVSSVTEPAFVSPSGSDETLPPPSLEIKHPSQSASPASPASAVKEKKLEAPFIQTNGEN